MVAGPGTEAGCVGAARSPRKAPANRDEGSTPVYEESYLSEEMQVGKRARRSEADAPRQFKSHRARKRRKKGASDLGGMDRRRNKRWNW